jgi:hypothetical protein
MSIVKTVVRAGPSKPHPFTICVVANPALEAPWKSGQFIIDPIIGQLTMFQGAVAYIDAALFGLLAGQREKMLSDPAIMPNVQIMSLYDDGLSVDSSTSLVAQDSVSDTLVARRTFFKPFLANYAIDADVAYAVSASSSHTRASAWFTTDDDTQPGVPFTLNGNPGFYHRYYNVIPGTVAIHSTASSLTALHEFGHAISSYSNGKILDLYVDSPVGFNNLLGRPIPSKFCDYNGKSFASDPSRDSLGYPANWQSFHNAPVDPACPAVMDNYWQSAKGPVVCLHDSVTVAFIGDRVLAKIGRP